MRRADSIFTPVVVLVLFLVFLLGIAGILQWSKHATTFTQSKCRPGFSCS